MYQFLHKKRAALHEKTIFGWAKEVSMTNQHVVLWKTLHRRKAYNLVAAPKVTAIHEIITTHTYYDTIVCAHIYVTFICVMWKLMFWLCDTLMIYTLVNYNSDWLCHIQLDLNRVYCSSFKFWQRSKCPGLQNCPQGLRHYWICCHLVSFWQ